MEIKVQSLVDRMGDLANALGKLTAQRVLVGFPAANAERTDEPITNAAIGYIQNYGAPEVNIPARPFMEPGIKDAQDEISNQLKDAAGSAIEGKAQAVDKSLHRAGMVASQAVKKRINDGDFTPLAEATLEARARRGRKGAQRELDSRAAGNTPSNAYAKPLVDTGALRNAVTYVIRKK